jgi:hypothetical protein
VAPVAAKIAGWKLQERDTMPPAIPGVRLKADRVPPHLQRLSDRYPRAVAWLRDNGWEVEQIPDRSAILCSRPMRFGYHYSHVRFSASTVKLAGRPADYDMLCQVKYQAMKVLELAKHHGGLDVFVEA